MKKTVIKLTESQLTKLIERTIKSMTEQFMGPTADEIHYNLYGTHLPDRKTPVKKSYSYKKDAKYYEQYAATFKRNFDSGLYTKRYSQLLKGMDPQSRAIYDGLQGTNEGLYYGIINNLYNPTKNAKIKNVKVTIQKVGDNDYQITQTYNKIN